MLVADEKYSVKQTVAGTTPHPFSGPPPETIPLDPPPLVQVLVQVRFSAILAVVREEFFAPVQQSLSDRYPIARKDQEILFPLGQASDQGVQTSQLWRLHDEGGVWRVTVAPMFVTFESYSYPGHVEFFDRLEEVLAAIGEHVRPARVERLGVRYVNRLDDAEDIARLEELVRPEMCGVASLDDGGIRPEHALTQSLFDLGTSSLAARWGILPPGATTDPALTASDQTSWLLDIDVFDESSRGFDVSELQRTAFEYSRRQYQFFRWSVEPGFLLRFGADPRQVAALTPRQG